MSGVENVPTVDRCDTGTLVAARDVRGLGHAFGMRLLLLKVFIVAILLAAWLTIVSSTRIILAVPVHRQIILLLGDPACD